MIGKIRSRSVKMAAGAVMALGFAAGAQAQTVSVNFGQAAYALGAGETAGVVAAQNWNNGTTAVGSILNLNDSTGTPTGVGVSWVGGGLTNNINATSSGSTGDNKLMSHSWGTANDMVAQNLFVETSGTRFHHHLQPNGFGQSTYNTATVTGLNALFPSGYNVIVYVSGASSGDNEATGAGNGANPLNQLQFASPVHVAVGPGGMNNTIQTGNNTGAKTFMSFGTDFGAAGYDGKSLADVSNLPAGSQRTILWPTRSTSFGYMSADFAGFVQGGLNQTDNLPIDFGPINEWGHAAFQDPWTLGEWPQNAWFGAAQPYQFFWDPSVRGIQMGNYIIFTGLNFDTLDLLAANVHGIRSGVGGSTTGIDMGGITGFQIVAAGGPIGIPSPAALPAGLALLLGAAMRRRRA